MTKKVKIQVTKEDIKKGKPEDNASCPVARAVRRVFKVSKKKVDVVHDCVTVNHKLQAVLPKIASNFIYAFDDGRKVKPFKMELTFEKCD